MPQFIQKVGGQAIDLATTSYKTLQDAANAGYSPVSAPVQPVQPAPITTPQPQNAPIITPTAPTNQISTKDLSASAGTNLEADAIKRNDILGRIKDTYTKVGGDAIVNPAFIQGLAQYKYGRAATADELKQGGQFGVLGMTVKDALGRFGLLDKMDGFGLNRPAEIKPADNTGTTNQPAETGKPKSITETLDEMLNFNIGDIRTEAMEEQGVAEKQTVVSTLKSELDTMKNEMDYNNILESKAVADVKNKYYEEKDALGARVMSTGYYDKLNSQLADKTNRELDMQGIENSIAEATNVYKYNSKLIEYNIALGDLQNAQQIVQQTATDALNMNTAKLNILQFKNQITQQDQAIMQKEIDREYDMATNGYTYVQSPSALQELAKQKGLQWVKDNTINIAGKIYVKPAPTIKSTIQSVINGQVHTLGIDEKGNVLKDFGASDIDQPTSSYGKIGTDANGNDIYGFIDTTNNTVTPVDLNSAVLPDGAKGGECGDYLHKVLDNMPSVGNTWESKRDTMNISTAEFIKSPQVGDVVAFKTKLPQGHVAVVTSVNGDGTFTVNESNYVAKHTVGTRDIKLNDPSILGAYRGATFKNGQTDNNAAKTAQDIFNGVSNLKLSDIPTKKREAVSKELNKLKEQAISEGNIDGIIRASAGGAAPSDTFIQSFEKAVNVVSQIEDLQASVDKEATGPIWGTIRSKNPYDVKAQLIKVQLQSIVPNLARGIYGEVGVLTDNDIKNYSQTLPNLTNLEEARNLILGATIRSVQRSIENKIKVAAGLGKDVSGISNVYNEVKAKADALEKSVSSSTTTYLIDTPKGNIDLRQFEK